MAKGHIRKNISSRYPISGFAAIWPRMSQTSAPQLENLIATCAKALPAAEGLLLAAREGAAEIQAQVITRRLLED